MENSAQRPGCNPNPPPVELTDRELLHKLLDIELSRLDTAVRIEKQRDIVFPETTIIIRDIQKLKAAINNLDNPKPEIKSEPQTDALDVFFKQLSDFNT